MLQLFTLGELRLVTDDGTLLSRRGKPLLLLTYLARRAPRASGRLAPPHLPPRRSRSPVGLGSHLRHLGRSFVSRLVVMQRCRVMALGTVAEIVARRPELAGLALEDVFLALIEEGERSDSSREPA
mgnify:CR=1 FL=1